MQTLFDLTEIYVNINLLLLHPFLVVEINFGTLACIIHKQRLNRENNIYQMSFDSLLHTIHGNGRNKCQNVILVSKYICGQL